MSAHTTFRVGGPADLMFFPDSAEQLCAALKEAGARRAMRLPVGGAFHSPLMEPARAELEQAIAEVEFHTPVCPIYQNVDAAPQTDPEQIKANLLEACRKHL